ncbi:MAG: PRC-barrel domain-containing protein [Povalibacter sp.]
MNALHTSRYVAVLILLSAAAAQSQQQVPDPRPATSETEGTAADRTPPGDPSTSHQNPSDMDQSALPVDPRPSTNPAEGTAADRTPPGKTPTTAGGSTAERNEMVGASVVNPSGTAIGKVVDVVFDSVSQPSYVVIASETGSAAVPYSVASSMKSGDKVVMDQARLNSAPKVKNGEWRSPSGKSWQQDANKYWQKGG